MRGQARHPPHPGIVAAYLSHLADRGRKSSTIGRRAAAIAHRDKFAGLEPPTSAGGSEGGSARHPPHPRGLRIAIPRGYRLRPVEAVQAWLAAAEISAGPLFRPVLKGGRIQPEALTAFSAAQIVKHYAERAGLDPAAFAGQSLRSGFLTSAAEAGLICSASMPGQRSCDDWPQR